MKDGVIYVNPCHGNEPYILGTLIAYHTREKLGRKNTIVIPHMYAGRQEKIISEELNIKPEELAANNICLDEKLGELHQQLLFGNNDFKGHLQATIRNHETVQKAVVGHLKNTYGDVYFEINAGSRVTSGATTAYSAFPIIVSELLERTLQDTELAEFFSPALLEPMLDIMKKTERGTCTFFIPQYNTFSYDRDRKPHAREVATPPLKPTPQKSTKDVPCNSVYCMLSGTDSEIKKVLENAQLFASFGRNIIVPPWAKDVPYDKQILQDVVSHENLIKVMGRPGWGTLWLCQVSGKDFLSTPYTDGDDPEIYFNIRTLAKIPMAEATEWQKETFKTLDGIAFVVDKIAKSL